MIQPCLTSYPKSYFKLWTGGLFNRLMSFECAVGIQSLLRSEMIVTTPRESKCIPSSLTGLPKYLAEVLNQHHQPWLEDLLDWSGRALFHFIDEEIQARRILCSRIINLFHSYIDCSGESDLNRSKFAHGRHCVTLDGADSLIFDRTLCWYSYLFFNRTEQLDRTLSMIRFKEPYRALAKKISASVGPFYGAHVRLSDFTRQFYSLSKPEISYGLDLLRVNRSLPLVIASDDHLHPLLSQVKSSCVFAEELILSDFRTEFRSLPFHDCTALAIVSNLLLGHSADFIGTPGSTFTGHIHRQLHQKGKCHWRFFCYPDGASLESPPPAWADGRIRTCARNWWREWPACALQS